MNEAYMRASTFAGDAIFIAPRRHTCESLARVGMPAYCYRFDTIPNGQVAPTHFHEVAFVFNNTGNLGYNLPVHPSPFLNKPASYHQLAEFMSWSWVSFFVTYDPNAWRRRGKWNGLKPEWPLYGLGGREDKPKILVFDAETSYVEDDTWRAEQIKLINDHAHAFQR